MSKQKLTEWFPADVKPVHVGWYHVFWRDGIKDGGRESGWNWWWDGENFLDGPGFDFPCAVTKDVAMWRGLADQPWKSVWENPPQTVGRCELRDALSWRRIKVQWDGRDFRYLSDEFGIVPMVEGDQWRSIEGEQ